MFCVGKKIQQGSKEVKEMIKKIEGNGKIISVQRFKKSSKFIIGKHILLTIAIDFPSSEVYEFLNNFDYDIKFKTIKSKNTSVQNYVLKVKKK